MAIKNKSIKEIEEIYELEIERIVKTIKKEKAQRVLLQFPEGMKPYSQPICNEIENKTNSVCFIWLDSCFGACDIPFEIERLGIDLIVQFGHSDWKFDNKKGIKIL